MIEWIQNAFQGHAVIQGLFIVSLVIAVGLGLGGIRIFGIRFGAAGVIFAGIIFGHLGFSVNSEILEFMREWGLILFVYAVGIQVGPGFFSTFKKDGIKLNILAAGVVLLGVLITIACIKIAHISPAVAVGIFSGSTTNTPSLAAAQETIKQIPTAMKDLAQMPPLAYAVTYPFGIFGIILTMIIIRLIFKISVEREDLKYQEHSDGKTPQVLSVNIEVENKNLNGVPIGEVSLFKDLNIVISRVMHDDLIQVAHPDTKLYLGDVVLVIGTKADLNSMAMFVGSQTPIDLREIHSDVSSRRLVVTRMEVTGKRLADVCSGLSSHVTVTRVTRTAVEFPANPDIELHYADTFVVVGQQEAMDELAKKVGDQSQDLGIPRLIPLFIGIALGMIVGNIPFHIPGVPVPVKLGMAGGPLVVAIILSRMGQIGRIAWYMPRSANMMIRELGISMFLAAVGIRSGGQFVQTLIYGGGISWMLMGVLVTLVPILTVGVIGRYFLKTNYLTLCGFLAGSMTDPPALAFANDLAKSHAQSVAYVSVYPLVMLLRVVAAQVIIINFLS